MKNITKEKIQELANKGLHQAEIARQLNCSRENIRQWCKRCNIKLTKHRYNRYV